MLCLCLFTTMSKLGKLADTNDTASRRTFLKYTAAGVGMAGIAGCTGGGGGSDGSGPIKIGDLSPRTGVASIYGIAKHRAAELAVEQQNEDGGLLDREIELIDPDPQTDNQKYKNLTQELILDEQVDMLAGTVLGAAREAIRPIIRENKQLTFVSQQYSGGLCDEYFFSTGPNPTQQMSQMIPYMIENFGTDVYIPAADYNFGRNSAARARAYIEEAGGNVVGEEFVPLSVSDFTSTINRINSEDPDWIMHLLVGNNHQNFFSQMESSGVNIPMGSTLAMALTYDHLVLDPPAMEDVYSCMAYFEELPSDRNKEFVEAMKAESDIRYVNQSASNHYEAYQYYFAAVEEAGTTDQQTVAETLESGDITVQVPEGEIRMTEVHESTHNVRLARATAEHEIEFLEEYGNMEPTWLAERCPLGPSDESTWDDPVTEWIQA
ncbi:ABC transporter substrate-binding protein [Halobellus sp. GM3]|uniref:ABC transporter substrate-binding protein n=1 Tax=Halobellus sp. GM3 TaxID=3458410 RepID=UPI00403E2EC0